MKRVDKKWLWLIIGLGIGLMASGLGKLDLFNPTNQPSSIASVSKQQSTASDLLDSNSSESLAGSPQPQQSEYLVTRVIDGDTIEIQVGVKTEKIRLIGIDTPESVDPRQPVECFGKEAASELEQLLEGRVVQLESDPTQSDRDKYGRWLRYVILDGQNINQALVQTGFAFEYTYQSAYKYQSQFKQSEQTARQNQLGLWSPTACNGERKPSSEVLGLTASPQAGEETLPANCVIKGNINTKNEKIYHLPGCGSYEKTQIDADRGERWFCTEDEASGAGWRKAGNCN